MTARLDRLGSAREVAQIGAVIGRDFSYKLLRAVAGIAEAPLQAALERLAEADILLVQGLPPASDYRFKHALIQDAAYENLLKSRRQVLHRRTAEVLRDQVAVAAAAEPEPLAHHFTQAGMTEAAIEWWRRRDNARFRARRLLRHRAAHGGARPNRDIVSDTRVASPSDQLEVALITPLYHVKGAAALETEMAAERARLLIEEAEALGEIPKTDSSCSRSSTASGLRTRAFNADIARELSSQFLALAEKQAGTVPLMVGDRLKGVYLRYAGKAEALTWTGRSLFMVVPNTVPCDASGRDVRVAPLALFHRPVATWLSRGFAMNQALRDARELGQATTSIYALATPRYTTSSPENTTRQRRKARRHCVGRRKSHPILGGNWNDDTGCRIGLTGKASEAVRVITSGCLCSLYRHGNCGSHSIYRAWP